MVEVLIFIIIGGFIWSMIGVGIGLMLLISEQQRIYIHEKLKNNPRFLYDVLVGLSMLGPLVIALMGYIKVKELVTDRIGGY